MLLAYFDESGEHDRHTGNLTRLALGGLLTNHANWDRIASEWNNALRDESVSVFHMADFEAYEGEFAKAKGWTEARHKQFLERLLQIITAEPITVVGISLPAIGARKVFRQTYANCATELIKQSYVNAKITFGHTPLSLVFSKTKEFSDRRISDYCKKISIAMPSLRSCIGKTPDRCPPLQAADLIAYELRCLNANNRRYPYLKMKCGPVSFDINIK